MKALNPPSANPARGRISEAWQPFAMSVADALERLQEDQFLIISAKKSNRFVQFAGQGSFGLRAEVVANAFLTPDEQIDHAGLDELREIGWSAPTGSPEESTPEQDPDGSPNYFMECQNSFDASRLAGVMVQTFRKVLGVHHPGFLEYEAFDTDGKRIAFPGLGLRRVRKKAKPKPSTSPAVALLASMRQITGIADLEFDDDGDVTVVYRDVVMYASLGTGPAALREAVGLGLLVPVDRRVEAVSQEVEIPKDGRPVHLQLAGQALGVEPDAVLESAADLGKSVGLGHRASLWLES
jgi:hypothetical protein